jgi:hypothetical protein
MSPSGAARRARRARAPLERGGDALEESVARLRNDLEELAGDLSAKTRETAEGGGPHAIASATVRLLPDVTLPKHRRGVSDDERGLSQGAPGQRHLQAGPESDGQWVSTLVYFRTADRRQHVKTLPSPNTLLSRGSRLPIGRRRMHPKDHRRMDREDRHHEPTERRSGRRNVPPRGSRVVRPSEWGARPGPR